MELTISSPLHGLVRFNGAPGAGCCEGPDTVCLPVVLETDLNFQVQFTGGSVDDANIIFDQPLSQIQLLLIKGTGNTGAGIEANPSLILRDWTTADGFLFTKHRTGLREVTYQWKNNLFRLAVNPAADPAIDSGLVKRGECFQLCIRTFVIVGDMEVPFYAFSDCFYRKPSTCDTSVFEFSNDEDFAGYRYCNVDGANNRVRVPLLIDRPQLIENEKVYEQSNGEVQMLNYQLREEFEGTTEHINREMHTGIHVIFGHDYRKIEADQYTGGFKKSNPYLIDWSDNRCVAPAAFKAIVTPVAIRNTNCGTCEDFVPEACPALGIQYVECIVNDDDTLTFVCNWDGVTSPPVTNVQVQYHDDAVDTWIDIPGSGIVGPRVLENMPFGYYYFQFIISGDCTGGPGAEIPSGYTDVCAPPSEFIVESVGNSEVNISWTPGSSLLVHYIVEKVSDGSVVQFGDNTMGMPENISGLTPSTNYRFRARCECDTGVFSLYSQKLFSTPA